MSLGDPNVFDVAQMPESSKGRKIDVLLVTSVALSFISFWRAASIVLCDLASTAYYIGGISEQAIGKAAPWFILAVMLFVFPVTAVYMESCTMFTRGGVYRVVKGAIGRNLAKLSVSALMFDYILTGPISSVSAGKYLLGLMGDLLFLITRHSLHPIIFDAKTHPEVIDALSVICAIGITCYFWRANLKGMHESSDKALRIMQATTVMGVLVVLWSLLSLLLGKGHLEMPPLHPVFTSTSLDSTKEASSGWLEHVPKLLGCIGLLVAFGHSLLAMSGEESLAQVNREIEAPKLKNLRRTGLTIFLYSLLLTGSISFLAVFLIPDGQRVMTQVVTNGADTRIATDLEKTWWEVDYIRPRDAAHHDHEWGLMVHRVDDEHILRTGKVIELAGGLHIERDNGKYRDNLINGLVQSLVGPPWLKILMEIVVVGVGFLILAGAVNTSILGSNGVMNRLAEDGVLTPWFQHPHPRFGTTHRLINMVAIVQVVVILFSLGDVDTLGEAYAFGVVWSFVFMTLSMMVLRFKDHSPRQYQAPLNIPIKTRSGVMQFPIGIMVVFLILISTAAVNLATKKTATIWGLSFTGGFLALFVAAETYSHRKYGKTHEHLEQFNQKSSEDVSVAALGLRFPNPVVVAARGPRSLPVLKKVLMEIDTEKRDVVVVTCKVLPPRTPGITESERSLDDNDRDLLTKIVTVAEEVGKQVHPLVIPTNNPLSAICTAARDLKATEVVLGVSEKVHAEEQLEQFAIAWGSATGEMPEGVEPPDMKVRILGPFVEMIYEMQ
jgi:amino acid transporter/nucleotide-binding universal stress UspA family protein